VTRSVLTAAHWNSGTITNASGAPVATIAHTSIFDAAFEAEVERSSGATIIAWSGRADDTDPDPFAADPRSWMPGGSAMPEFLARLDALVPILRRTRVRVLIRPHARHIVSDVPRAVAMLHHHSKSTTPHFGLALEPSALLEPSMVPAAIDHARRALESLGHRASIVILTNIAGPASPDAWFTLSRLESGLIPGAELVNLAEHLVPHDCPIAVLPGDDAALAALRSRARYTGV